MKLTPAKWTARLSLMGIGCLLLAAPISAVRADDATTQPTPGTALSGPILVPPLNSNPQEWADLMQFLEVNSPARANALNVLGTLSGSMPLKQNMLRQYRRYKLVEDQFPDMAKLMLTQFKLEDDVFELTNKARNMNIRAANQQIRPLIQTKEQQIVDLQLEQEQLRIDRLESTLNDEKARLVNLKNNEQQTVLDRTNGAMPPRMRTRPNQQSQPPATNPSGQMVDENHSQAADSGAGNDTSNPADPMSGNGYIPIEGGK